MYSAGELVMYGVHGVMEIVGTENMTVLDVARQYLVLKEYGSSGGSLTYVPMDNTELLATVRPLLSREELTSLIKEAKAGKNEEWEADSRQRSKRFREIIASGDRKAMISMIHSIYTNGKLRAGEGKKNYLADENAMRKAEKLLYTEIAAVFGMPIDEVPSLIKKM